MKIGDWFFSTYDELAKGTRLVDTTRVAFCVHLLHDLRMLDGDSLDRFEYAFRGV
jgi:hypothetical protein